MITEEGFVFDCIYRWLDIREKNSGVPFPSSLIQLKIDIEHSALLQRLLEHKEPFPEPPPLRYSYPNYQLLETGHMEVSNANSPGEYGDIHYHKAGGFALTTKPFLNIMQSIWVIEQELGGNDYICRYMIHRDTGLYEFSNSRWHVQRIDLPNIELKALSKVWYIDRVAHNDTTNS